MRTTIFFTTLLINSTFFTAFSETTDLIGVWKGPKDLTINLCITPDSRLYVCHCGIFRTFGWANVASTVTGDSLIMTATDLGSPFEGRFKIESEDKLTGTLTMGEPGEYWYFNDQTELIRQKPEIPGNISSELEGTILPSDYEILSLDREKTWEALSTIPPTLYGYAEKRVVEKLLNAPTYPVTPEEMIGFRRVRSIQIDPHNGIFSYPYFNCRFLKTEGNVFFEKSTGSQRKSGHVYQNNSESLIFLGGWSVNNAPQTHYGGTNSVAGTIYKIGKQRAIMIFPSHEDWVEIYELTK